MDGRAEGAGREPAGLDASGRGWSGLEATGLEATGLEAVGGSVEYIDGSVPRVDGSVLRVDGAELRAAGAACFAAAQAFAQVAAFVVARGATGSATPGPRAAPGPAAEDRPLPPATRRALGEAIDLWERAGRHLGALFGDLGERLEGIDVAFGEVDDALAGSLARLGR